MGRYPGRFEVSLGEMLLLDTGTYTNYLATYGVTKDALGRDVAELMKHTHAKRRPLFIDVWRNDLEFGKAPARFAPDHSPAQRKPKN